VLWTAYGALERRYRVAVASDGTMVHRESAPAGRQQAALDIMHDIIKADVLTIDELIARRFLTS
jgi:hypothetical protein